MWRLYSLLIGCALLTFPSILRAQETEFSLFKVVDQTTNQPLIYATVILERSRVGVISDEKGVFRDLLDQFNAFLAPRGEASGANGCQELSDLLEQWPEAAPYIAHFLILLNINAPLFDQSDPKYDNFRKFLYATNFVTIYCLNLFLIFLNNSLRGHPGSHQGE